MRTTTQSRINEMTNSIATVLAVIAVRSIKTEDTEIWYSLDSEDVLNPRAWWTFLHDTGLSRYNDNGYTMNGWWLENDTLHISTDWNATSRRRQLRSVA